MNTAIARQNKEKPPEAGGFLWFSLYKMVDFSKKEEYNIFILHYCTYL